MKAAALLLIVIGGLVTAFGVMYAVSNAGGEAGVNLPVLIAAVLIGGIIDVAGVILLVKSQRSM
jgi:hypothetical protein